MLSKVQERMRDNGIKLEFTKVAKQWLADEGFDSIYGARPLRRTIQRTIENPLSFWGIKLWNQWKRWSLPMPLGTVGGADRTRTQSFLLKIVRAPGAAARLYADVSLQNWTSLARVSARPVIWIP